MNFVISYTAGADCEVEVSGTVTVSQHVYEQLEAGQTVLLFGGSLAIRRDGTGTGWPS